MARPRGSRSDCATDGIIHPDRLQRGKIGESTCYFVRKILSFIMKPFPKPRLQILATEFGIFSYHLLALRMH